MVQLTLVEFLTGFFNLIFVIISIIVGIKILLKYFEVKYKHLISLGIIWIILSTPWMHGALAFILLYFDIILAEEIRFIIAYAFIPIAALLWYNTYTILQNIKARKFIIISYAIIVIICELLFFIFLLSPDREILIGYFERTFSARYSPFFRFSLMFFLFSSLIPFYIFAGKSIKSSGEIKIKGIFLVIAFSTYAFCAVMDSFFLFNPIIVVLIRVLLMSSAIEFYCGWILPEPIKRIFLKNRES